MPGFNALSGDPMWFDSGMTPVGEQGAWPPAPPSRADAAYQTSIDRWKQLGKDVFFAPSNALRDFNQKPTFMNALGVMPMGTFGGALAKTADRVALANAQRMWGVGASKEEIWNKTGWFPGPDGKWRFEIPDNKAQLNPNVYAGAMPEKITAKAAGQLWHPDLYAAYPDARKTQMTIRSGSREGEYNYSAPSDTPFVSVNARTSQDARSVALHEMQHDVQRREGFARGANKDAIYRDLPEYSNNSIVEQMRAGILRGDYGTLGDPAFIQATKQFWALEKQAKEAIAADLYQRSAGEVEARAVQKRMDLTPEQRRARYPWLDYDVPVEQQIVNGGWPSSFNALSRAR